MRLNPSGVVFCFVALSATALACSSDVTTRAASEGSGGGGTAGSSSAAGGASAAGANSAGSFAGSATAGTSTGGAAGSAGSAGSDTAGTGGTSGSGGTTTAAVCGDGTKAPSEVCDDGGTAAGDGCSATCTVEPGYTCPSGGGACTPTCGDGMLIAPEACDDGDTTAGDGCSDTCSQEPGWDCAVAAEPCSGICGDGILADELCDDGNVGAGDGCSATCAPEPGFTCDIPGAPCRTTPDCSGGACTSVCGDGLVIGEECDDGNTADDDGCSSTCDVESGWTCETVAAALPDQLAIPVIYRDFVSTEAGGSTRHPDFFAFGGDDVTPDMVEAELAGGLPVYTGVCEQDGPNAGNGELCPYGAQTTSEANFDQWYRDTEGVNLSFPGVVLLGRVNDSQAYVFDGGDTFTPLTNEGWDAAGQEGQFNDLNFGYTTELRYFFNYKGDEVLEFSGDDDVWVFINNRLAVDIGGLHKKVTKSITLGVQVSTLLDLNVGTTYEIALFHAERHPDKSNFKLTLTGFVNEISECTEN